MPGASTPPRDVAHAPAWLQSLRPDAEGFPSDHDGDSSDNSSDNDDGMPDEHDCAAAHVQQPARVVAPVGLIAEPTADPHWGDGDVHRPPPLPATLPRRHLPGSRPVPSLCDPESAGDIVDSDDSDDSLDNLFDDDNGAPAAGKAEPQVQVHGGCSPEDRADFAAQTGMGLTQQQPRRAVVPTVVVARRAPTARAATVLPTRATISATFIKFWGIDARQNGTHHSTYYVYWDDGSSTYETYKKLLKWHNVKPKFLSDVKKKTWKGKRTPLGVGARRCLRPATSAKRVSRAVAGVVVGGCGCVGLGSAGRCGGSCLYAGTSAPWSSRESSGSSFPLLAQPLTAGATPAAPVGPVKRLQHQAAGGWCVLNALFNGCHHSLGRTLPPALQTTLRAGLGPVSDLKRLSVVLDSLGKKSPVGLRKVKTHTLAGVTPLQWVLRQSAGLFLVADHAHCVAVDCRRQRVYDCAEEFPLALSLDVLSQRCGIDVQGDLVAIRAVHSK
jgi:hypothetical protein